MPKKCTSSQQNDLVSVSTQFNIHCIEFVKLSTLRNVRYCKNILFARKHPLHTWLGFLWEITNGFIHKIKI